MDSEIAGKIVEKTKKTSAILKQKFEGYSNAVTNSRMFKDKCRVVFESVDVDNVILSLFYHLKLCNNLNCN